jgi:peptidoglycan/xylan/chitin deacetylase (PgdA/CDA1 family)
MKIIPILMYHQVDDMPPSGSPLRGMTVSPQRFAQHMRFLKTWGFQGLSMRELEPYLSGSLSGRVVGITFDDGYANTHTNALPILRQFGYTATCYAVSRLVGGHNHWDTASGMATKALMDISAWREWIDLGMDVGSHTCDHIDLSQSDETTVRHQIQRSKSELEHMLGTEVRHFCYPYGRFLPEHPSWVQQAGYVTATTTRRGRVPSDLKPAAAFTLPRVLVNHRSTWLHMALKLFSRYEEGR